MTLQDLVKLRVDNVYIRSYGYTEVTAFGGIWQPFKNCRKIKFRLDKDGSLDNPTFWCEEDPSLDDEFNFIEGKYISVQDYDLCSRDMQK